MRKLTIAAIAVGAVWLHAQTAENKTAGTRTAAEVYKNITVMKDVPADQVGPAMQFIATSLGVECSFCHVQGKFDADDKAPKKTAREMMAMTASINKSSFNGRQQITCFSCHHGATHPSNTPPVLESDAPVHSEARPPAPAGAAPPNADEVIEKYVSAVGGEDAIRKIGSRVETGKILAMGTESPIEVIAKAPNKRISISHMGNGESITAYDGSGGWLGSTGRPPREMSPTDAASAALDAEFYLPVRLKQMFQQIRPGRPEEINGARCNVLIASTPGHAPVRLYFEESSGLLVRMVRYAETPMGRMPTQIDYADYRAVDGVKIPFRWTLARANGRFTIQIAEVKSNVPVDDARFTKPAAEVK